MFFVKNLLLINILFKPFTLFLQAAIQQGVLERQTHTTQRRVEVLRRPQRPHRLQRHLLMSTTRQNTRRLRLPSPTSTTTTITRMRTRSPCSRTNISTNLTRTASLILEVSTYSMWLFIKFYNYRRFYTNR